VTRLWKFPWAYPWRSLLVRWQSSLFSAVGIAMTVAVLCGVFALRLGLAELLTTTGEEDVVVYMRVGATSEGESGIPLDRVQKYVKERPEVLLDERGRPLAAGETYLALYLPRRDGSGEANVPLRGVEDASFAIQGEKIRVLEGRRFSPGADEVIVGRPLVSRVAGCEVGGMLRINVTPFRVVGVFEHDGAYGSEIWGDVDRLAAALERPIRQRVVAKLGPGWSAERVAEDLEGHKELAAKVQSERAYFASQTRLVDILQYLGAFLTIVLGVAAVLGATNTMLAAVGARTREVGILRAMGFGRFAILVAFLIEAALIGLVGGLAGAVLVLPLDGIETGTMNWNTFTETAFAFRVDAKLLATAVVIAVLLGLVGGLFPAWRASRLQPVEALRRG
jgi:putative ABC transport system permease protein